MSRGAIRRLAEGVPHQTRARVLNALVRRGPRTVVWAQEDMHLGNILYWWLRVHTQQAKGLDYRVLSTSAMTPWLDYFPGLAERMLIDRDQVTVTDRREPGFFQGWGAHYWPEHLERFVDEVLIPSRLPLDRRPPTPGRVVVNVRRGDYFGAFADRYSFHEVEYLRIARDRQRLLGGEITEVHVVSDDIGWCRERLGWLGDDGAELTFQEAGGGPVADFATIASARRLILTHSSFGYWGAHVSNGLHRDNHDLVVVPWFHDRSMWSGASYHLNPAWTVVRHLPGGWGPEPPP